MCFVSIFCLDSVFFFGDVVNHEMDVGLHGLGVHPPVQPVIPKGTLSTRGFLFFNSTFCLGILRVISPTLPLPQVCPIFSFAI